MNVTYLIGNGFDLGIGLKTGFTHFLEYYLSVETDDEDIKSFKNTIREDTIELWADLELCFGQYIEIYDKKTVLNYIKIYEDILFNLNKYLKDENKKISYDIGYDVRNKFINDMVELDNLFIRNAILNDIINTGYFKDNNITYNFITFNYTTALDHILYDIFDQPNNQLYVERKPETIYKMDELLHIHGKLDSNAIIFGVNDAKQISFSGNVPDKIKRRIIKPFKNSLLGNKTDIRCQEIIEKSDIICIYGMSIGETDAIWWQKIGNWLINSQNRRVICFVYNKNVNTTSVCGMDNLLDAEFEYRNRFIRIAKFPEDFRDVFEQRFHVIINPNFMQMNLVKKETKSETTV